MSEDALRTMVAAVIAGADELSRLGLSVEECEPIADAVLDALRDAGALAAGEHRASVWIAWHVHAGTKTIKGVFATRELFEEWLDRLCLDNPHVYTVEAWAVAETPDTGDSGRVEAGALATGERLT